MADLYLALAILVALAGFSCWLALRITRHGPRIRVELLGVLGVLAMSWWIVHFWDPARLAPWLPFSNLIVLGNWHLPGAGFMAGLAWRRVQGSPARRYGLIGTLGAVAFYSAVFPMLGQRPPCGDRWLGDVCLQTSQYTCSAASAATLLKAHGIDATEEEMADLCLTRRGTTWAGLYRGLKRKTAGTDWDVEFFVATPLDLAEKLHQLGPAILSVGVDAGDGVDAQYVGEWGWVPGQRHSVVLFGFIGPRAAVIGDPAVGRELWSWNDLRTLWQGEGLRLVRKRPSDAIVVAGRP